MLGAAIGTRAWKWAMASAVAPVAATDPSMGRRRIRTRGLAKAFAGRTVVDNVDLQAAEREIFGPIGTASIAGYEVDAPRTLMLKGGASRFGLGLDGLVLVAVIAVLVAIATRLYPRMTM